VLWFRRRTWTEGVVDGEGAPGGSAHDATGDAAEGDAEFVD